jgi:hypothetical protein
MSFSRNLNKLNINPIKSVTVDWYEYVEKLNLTHSFSVDNRIGIVKSGVQLDPLGTAVIVPAMVDYDDGEIGGMIGRGNRSTRRKPAPVLLCPPQNPHAARTRTRAAALGSQRLTA